MSMRRDLIFNIIGKVWSLLSGFLFVPFYIKLLGFSSFSFISLSLVLYNIVLLLDLGISASVGREMARKDLSKNEKITTYSTLESIYLCISITVILLFIFFQDAVAAWVIQNSEFSITYVSNLLMFVGFDLGLQLLFRFTISTLIGLEKHFESNVFQITWSVLRNGGVVLVLLYLPSLKVFFIYQSASTLVFALLSIFFIRSQLYSVWHSNLFHFDMSVIRRVYRFAFGMLLVTVVSTLNTQLDKLVLTNYYELDTLGYYNLAYTLSSVIIVSVAPIGTTVLPRLTSLVSLKQHHEVRDLYLLIFKIVTIVSVGFVLILHFWGLNILELWTGERDIAISVNPFLRIIVNSSGLLAIGTIAFNLAIANGFTKFMNIVGVSSLLISLPGYFFAVNNLDATGVVYITAGVQVLSSLILIFYLSRKLLYNRGSFHQVIRTFVLTIFLGILIFSLGFLVGETFVKDSQWLVVLLGTFGVYAFILYSVMFNKEDRRLFLIKLR